MFNKYCHMERNNGFAENLTKSGSKNNFVGL